MLLPKIARCPKHDRLVALEISRARRIDWHRHVRQLPELNLKIEDGGKRNFWFRKPVKTRKVTCKPTILPSLPLLSLLFSSCFRYPCYRIYRLALRPPPPLFCKTPNFSLFSLSRSHNSLPADVSKARKANANSADAYSYTYALDSSARVSKQLSRGSPS